MKIRYLIFFFLLSFTLSSCHKEETDEERFKRELSGDYDWKTSTSLEMDGGSSQPLVTYDPNINGNNYGLRIKKNGKAFLYENGKQIKKGSIRSITPETKTYYEYYEYTTYYLVAIEFEKELDTFISEGSGLINLSWPYSNCKNNFLPISK